MSLENFYVERVSKKKEEHTDLYKETLQEVLGKEIEWAEFKELDRDNQRHICVKLENKIKLHESPIDPKKLAQAIQFSRSGAGGCAMTNFTCNFCGKEEVWTNTAIPNICKSCATEMALKIAMYHPDILKEGL